MTQEKRSEKEFTYKFSFVDPPDDYSFDIEQWLAEILFEYYLKTKSE